jgi:hypothetical protein
MSGQIINYNSKLFEVLKDLSKISSQMILKLSDDGKIGCKQSTPDSQIAFILSAPKTYFEIPADVAIYNYPEFYQFFSILDKPTIIIENNKIIFSDAQSTIEYYFSNPESCSEGIAVKWNNPTVSFDLSKDDLNSLIKASSIISTGKEKHAQISVDNNNQVKIDLVDITINKAANQFNKSFSKIFQGTKITEEVFEPFNFMINAGVFVNSPLRDYKVEIKKGKAGGYMRLYYIDSEVNVDIFATYLKTR